MLGKDKPNLNDLSEEQYKERVDVYIDKERWRNRRAMAWIALIAMLGATGAFMFVVPAAKLAALGAVVAWFYGAMMSIIGVYIGFTTWSYISGKNKPPEPPSAPPSP